MAYRTRIKYTAKQKATRVGALTKAYAGSILLMLLQTGA